MRFRAKDSAIHEKIAPLRANHIARITSDFKMDLVKVLNISGGLGRIYEGPRTLVSVVQMQKPIVMLRNNP